MGLKASELGVKRPSRDHLTAQEFRDMKIGDFFESLKELADKGVEILDVFIEEAKNERR